MRPVICLSDYNTLKSLIANCPPHLKTKEIVQLSAELERAEITENDKSGNDVIKLNSIFEAEEVKSKKIWKLTLTLPEQANVKEQKISVFSPLGIALIGFKKGMTVKWNMPGGEKNIHIHNVIN